MSASHSYIGRFAPTPSGPLHFGSLVAALASYLDARSAGGHWLLRIEDIDPPREQPGAADQILRTLEAFELFWDGPVFYQSQQNERYQYAVELLQQRHLAYPCRCSRKQLRDYPVYPGWCREHSPDTQDSAIRVITSGQFQIQDRIQDYCHWNMADIGDFIIQRRDKLFAYQLAVILDDHDQGVNQVVRGFDILDSTPRQLQLLSHMDLPVPQYAHIPVIVNPDGQKLSKQNLAPAIQADERLSLLIAALNALGHTADSSVTSCGYQAVMEWAIKHWDIDRIPGCAGIPVTQLCPES
ncbi:tRNA glutamyl-Q(34) synthetase GluQRS [Oceanospirillum sediminis]|uniref:Glutamyl-Q tRNA(Asp) synthetase n=1 Tax=Oceanospirillum sediminis TaxID=2760088 RepID=A0A839IUC3_9GAMM|nr:tRNA glutamyl-Q(34) synthetase GluQRS [Oceanospirillum sediminis]MBB1488079.1 tRNA glutamyl-Q(34) synthetase GluQRS [Oceanospirillum sediminis]